MAKASSIIAGWHPERGALFVAVDPASRFSGEGQVAELRFAALLRPFTSEEAAVAALAEAGASLPGGAK